MNHLPLLRRVGIGAAALALVASALTWLAPLPAAANSPVVRYVATNGSDSTTDGSPNDCTDQTHPCATIGYAANYDMTYGTGDTTVVEVAPGTYNGSVGIGESVEIDGGVDFQHTGAGATTVTDDSGSGDPTIVVPSGEIFDLKVTLHNLNISGNTSADGVSVAFGNSVAITDSIINNNSGAGVDVGASSHAEITDTTIDGNSGAGVLVNTQVPGGAEPDVTVTGSTISHNATGGVVVESGVTVINTSTIAANAGQGVFATGSSTVVGVIDSTVAGTTSPGAGSGGIVETSGASVQVNGTIAADQAAGIPDCAGTITDLGYNLSSDSSCSSFTNATDQQNADPLLGPLANNGGATLTMLPGASSPALDQIPSSLSGVGQKGTCDSRFPTDQRGIARPAGAACDIGAVEVQPPAPPVVSPPAAPAPPASAPEVCPPLVIDTKTLPDGTVGKPYSVPLKAHGGCDDDYAWAVPGGAPDGGFPKTGSQITVPTGSWQQVGGAAGQAPKSGASASDTPQAGTTSDTTATGASNTTGPGRSVNTAPPGLTVTPGGVLRGTPTKAGTFTFTVSVDDPVLATLVLVVHAPAAATTNRAPSPSTTTGPPSPGVGVAGRSNTASDNPTAAPGGSLASTGAPVDGQLRWAWWLLAAGTALVLAGSARLRIGRRRPARR